MDQRSKLQSRLDSCRQEQNNLKSEVLQIGFIKSGSVTKRTLTCGKKTCACHKNSKARHGPYVYWTTKVRGKTVAKLLKDKEARLCIEYVKNRKRLDKIIRRWMRLSDKAFKTALRIKDEPRSPEDRKSRNFK